MSPGGVLGPKIAGGVPRATENWTQKDRGKNGILGPKRSNFARICTQKIVFVLVDEKKHPKKIEFGTQRVKKAAHMYHPSYREYPPPPPPPPPLLCHAEESLQFLASDWLRNGSWARGSVPGGSATISLMLTI